MTSRILVVDDVADSAALFQQVLSRNYEVRVARNAKQGLELALRFVPDLIILDQNPLTDIKNTNTIRFVMKNGELFEGDTLNQLWPTPKPLEPQYWWNNEPKDVVP